MVARRIRTSLIATLAALAVAAIPAVASANPTTESLSSVDAIAADVSVDGSLDTSKPETSSSASDSPTITTYGGGKDKVPPPVDCSTDGGSTDAGGGKPGEGKPSTDKPSETCTDTVIECSDADTDGLDANGKPCVECSSVDTDGVDASGKPCVTETSDPVTEPCVETDGGGDLIVGGGAAVCGGGGADEAPAELPIEEPEVVAGGGDAPTPTPVAGGGGPELPFTGLPLSSALWGGFGLMLIGAVMWFRGRGHQAG